MVPHVLGCCPEARPALGKNRRKVNQKCIERPKKFGRATFPDWIGPALSQYALRSTPSRQFIVTKFLIFGRSSTHGTTPFESLTSERFPTQRKPTVQLQKSYKLPCRLANSHKPQPVPKLDSRNAPAIGAKPLTAGIAPAYPHLPLCRVDNFLQDLNRSREEQSTAALSTAKDKNCQCIGP